MSEKLTLTKLELLRMARELVINEYIDKRAQDHNAWLAQADVVWRTQGVRLAYPSFPQYPNEIDILTRAQALNNFLSPEDQAAEKIDAEKADAEKAAANTVPAQSLISDDKSNNVIEVRSEDVKEVTPPQNTNYISQPELYAEVLKKQPTAAIPQIPDLSQQPMSALDRLKSSLGLK